MEASCFKKQELTPHVDGYTLYADPRTPCIRVGRATESIHRRDALPVRDVDRWFGSRDEAIAALPDLLNREEPDTPHKSDSPDPS
jgi:hypothetical protein